MVLAKIGIVFRHCIGDTGKNELEDAKTPEFCEFDPSWIRATSRQQLN